MVGGSKMSNNKTSGEKIQKYVEKINQFFRYIPPSLFRGKSITAVDTWYPVVQHERRKVMGPGPLSFDGGSLSKKPNKFGEEWTIKFDYIEELPGIVKIVEKLNYSDAKTKKKSLTERVKETLVTEPIKAFFAIIACLIIAFLLST